VHKTFFIKKKKMFGKKEKTGENTAQKGQTTIARQQRTKPRTVLRLGSGQSLHDLIFAPPQE
jgi:hypothetical protein